MDEIQSGKCTSFGRMRAVRCESSPVYEAGRKRIHEICAYSAVAAADLLYLLH